VLCITVIQLNLVEYAMHKQDKDQGYSGLGRLVFVVDPVDGHLVVHRVFGQVVRVPPHT
jgi:hypothetical protein